ncbi:MAG: F420-0:Gamma-glutamyl ligase [Synechococcales cyanobacterium K44_A2020_017]|nr:F420-0:Gamma-glutamyl ligase [Synechococcales cyanobacterium K32_A2020_035]MBF2093169.1 F420-0:Gamma-glutamyl ligase [Synechococcales cyanobacterium K44_A2020_017]
MGSLGILIGAIALLLVLGWIAIEVQYRRRPGNRLQLRAGTWNLDVYEPQHYRIVGDMEFVNQTQRLELMVPEVSATATLLSKNSLDTVQHTLRITPCHPDADARDDGYWFGYIVKIGKTTRMEVVLDVVGDQLEALQAAWIKVRYVTYGPQGRVPKTRHVIVPLRFPSPDAPIQWRSGDRADILPVKTHLLTHLDDPVEVVKRYVMPHAQPGDIVTIGETPIAIMQDRFRHPTTVQPGWVARRLCYYFMPTSSLATACGMQTLVDISGPWRVVFAFLVGAIAKKIFKRPGMFYQLAGEQARLIDDVTGTLPPYDQFIVLGPEDPQRVVNQIQAETGLAAAIVDVNDLRAVKVLAASSGIAPGLLEQALITNPAGNADEQTPVVLIRPK